MKNLRICPKNEHTLFVYKSMEFVNPSFHYKAEDRNPTYMKMNIHSKSE